MKSQIITRINKLASTHLKRILYLLLFSILIVSFKQSEPDSILTNAQSTFIKKNFKWDGENLLITNYVHSSENCFYNNNKNFENSALWWNDFYANIDLQNALNIYVYSDKIAAVKIIDNSKRFEDKDDFLLNNFFSLSKKCHGLLIVNGSGEYQIIEGEYSKEHVEKIIKTLSN